MIPVHLTPEEQSLYEQVTDYVRRGYRSAVDRRDVITGFLMVIFQKLLTSSTRALLAALERRRAKLVGERAEAELEETLREGNQEELVLAGVSAREDGDDEDADELSQLLSVTTALSGKQVVHAEIGVLDDLIARIRRLPGDSKAAQLRDAVARILEVPGEKVLIFTQFLETQRYLREIMQSAGHTVEVFSGTMSVGEKDAAVERFRSGAQVLISTEAGGEGRNFQFCHIMFNYDLPWNPMRVEQRIGRLDRIGQQKAVHIYNFAAVGTIEERILDVLQHRIRLFEETIGGLDPILGEFERDLQRLIMESRPNFSQAFIDFGVNWERRVAEARRMEDQLKDFVMDLRSFRRDEADRLLARQRPVSHTDLRDFVRDFLTMYPVGKFEEREDGSIVIDVPQAFIQDVGGKIRDRYVGTFDPTVALQRESLDFFAIGHPLVDAILEICQASRFGGLTAIRVVECATDAGFWGVQCNFVVDFSGVRKYPRFIPIVVGFDGSFSEEKTRRVWAARIMADHNVALPDTWRDGVTRALRQSEELLIERVNRELPELEMKNRGDYEPLRVRTEKQYEFRIVRARERLAEYRTALERFRRSRDPGERRVIGIWEGRVRDETTTIERLQAERDTDLRALEDRRRVEYSFDLANAAIVYVSC